MTRPSSTKVRRECFDAHRWADHAGRIMLTCHICGGNIDPAREKWEAEHTTPRANGGVDVRPAHAECHKPKTAKDIGDIAKGKRVHDRHFGIKVATRPMPGSRRSRFKKHMDGRVTER